MLGLVKMPLGPSSPSFVANVAHLLFFSALPTQGWPTRGFRVVSDLDIIFSSVFVTFEAAHLPNFGPLH